MKKMMLALCFWAGTYQAAECPANRDRYHNLDSFVTRIVDFYNEPANTK
jgi:hypothetical protein